MSIVTRDSSSTREQRRRSVFEESKCYGERVFDPEVSLCSMRPGNPHHTTRELLIYAMALLEGENNGEISRGCNIVDAVLSIQELDQSSNCYGSFKWKCEAPGPPGNLEVKFICPPLVHMVVFYPHKLGEDRVERIRRALSAAASSVLGQGFHVNYTNIALLSCLSFVAIGEWFRQDDIVEKGCRTLDYLISQTNEQGAPTEFNSPTYSFVSLLALAWLRKLTKGDEIGLKTRILEDRIWLQLASHYHPPTGLLGGPYSRGYQHDVTGECSLVGLGLYIELGIGSLWNPAKIFKYHMSHNILWGIPASMVEFHMSEQTKALFLEKDFPYLTVETTDSVANRVERSLITTYQTAGYSLGTASRGYHYVEQANSFLLHYRRHGGEPGVVYTRLRLGDSRYGSHPVLYLESSKPNDDDRGTLYSVQKHNRVVGVYTVPKPFETGSVCLDLVWPDRSSLDELWVGERRISSLPAEFDIDETICIGDGDIFLGLRALPGVRGSKASGARGVLHIEGGYLYLSLYSYRGPSRKFERTDMLSGFVSEVADYSLEGGLNAFRQHCSKWHVTDSLWDGRIKEAGLTCGHGSLEMRYDLLMERIIDRHADGEPVVPVMFQSPSAGQGRGGVIQVGGSRLVASKHVSALLAADEKSMRFTAVNPELLATPITLETPRATVHCGSFAFGSIDLHISPGGGGPVLDVRVETLYHLEPIEIRTELPNVRIRLNGKDVSIQVERRLQGLFVLPVSGGSGIEKVGKSAGYIRSILTTR